ncbi:hypothetical protein AB6889_02460 [Carnobacterium maltaromaticum]|uniref:hypothetical protein n=1 Tax=Carnobacterium maltaromaticum TaxID=2751 RepID=UPI0039BECD7D
MKTLDELKMEAEKYYKTMQTNSISTLFHFLEGEQLSDESEQKALWDHIQGLKDK